MPIRSVAFLLAAVRVSVPGDSNQIVRITPLAQLTVTAEKYTAL